MLIIFLVLIIGPVIVRKYITGLPTIPLDLVQPTGQNNNDTTTGITGSALVNFGNAAGGGGSAAATAAATSANSDDPFSFGAPPRFMRW